MELFDLYTADREKTGRTMVRGEPTPAGFYRLVVHICIFNSEGQMLIQQRQPFKEDWSNMWDVSVGGCSRAGETSQEAAHRELLEEIGLDVDFTGIVPHFTVNWEHGFDDVYLLKMDLDPKDLVLQEEEVQNVRWATKEEIKDLIRKGEFITYHESLIDMEFSMCGQYGVHSSKDLK